VQTIEILEKTFDSESNDIALYLAMSQRAEEEGHPEIAAYLLKVAMDEARHAAEFASLLGKIKDTKTNLVMMLAKEIKAETDKAEAAKIAQAEGHDNAFQFFERALHDEGRHKEGIKEVLLKLGKGLNQINDKKS